MAFLREHDPVYRRRHAAAHQHGHDCSLSARTPRAPPQENLHAVLLFHDAVFLLLVVFLLLAVFLLLVVFLLLAVFLLLVVFLLLAISKYLSASLFASCLLIPRILIGKLTFAKTVLCIKRLKC